MKRQTLAKRIESADAKQAAELALHGRTFTEIERQTRAYLFFRRGMENCIRVGQPEDNPDRQGCTEMAKATAGYLVQSILDSISRGDSAALRAVADAMDGFRAQGNCDRRRAHILALKGILNERGETMTLARLAELVQDPETEDGHAALRRMARKLRFPLTKRGPGRPRKIQTRKRQNSP